MQRLDISRFLTQLPALAKELLRLEGLQKRWQNAVPANLAKHSFAINIDAGVLTVVADSGAVASKLKLISPSVVKRLQNEDAIVTTLRVKVRVSAPPAVIAAHYSFEAAQKRRQRQAKGNRA